MTDPYALGYEARCYVSEWIVSEYRRQLGGAPPKEADCHGPLTVCRIISPLAIKEAYPYGAWDAAWRRREPRYFRAVPLDVSEGPKMNARSGRERADIYRSLSDLFKDPRNETIACTKHAGLAGWRECEKCGGRGGIGRGQIPHSCPDCHGTGWLAPSLVLPVEAWPTVTPPLDALAAALLPDLRSNPCSPLREYAAELGLTEAKA